MTAKGVDLYVLSYHCSLDVELPRISGHLDVALAGDRFAADGSRDLRGAFPIRHSCAAIGDELLLRKSREYFEFHSLGRNRDFPPHRIVGAALWAFPMC